MGFDCIGMGFIMFCLGEEIPLAKGNAFSLTSVSNVLSFEVKFEIGFLLIIINVSYAECVMIAHQTAKGFCEGVT